MRPRKKPEAKSGKLGCFPEGQGFWRKDGQLISHGKKIAKSKMDRRLSSSIQMRKDEGLN